MGPIEVLWDGDGVPAPQVWTDKQTENITSPILLMRAIKSMLERIGILPFNQNIIWDSHCKRNWLDNYKKL